MTQNKQNSPGRTLAVRISRAMYNQMDDLREHARRNGIARRSKVQMLEDAWEHYVGSSYSLAPASPLSKVRKNPNHDERPDNRDLSPALAELINTIEDIVLEPHQLRVVKTLVRLFCECPEREQLFLNYLQEQLLRISADIESP